MTRSELAAIGCTAASIGVFTALLLGSKKPGVPSAPPTSATLTIAAPPFMPFTAAPIVYADDFDVEKKNRQIDWCREHHGRPALTFTFERSNVICLKADAVIAIPREDGGK
jgi:hypothetical protein